MINWFDVDKDGLAKLLEEKGKAFAVAELLQNAWDAEGTTEVSLRLRKHLGDVVELTVIDNSPKGFCDLSHAYTLFSPSAKKSDVTKRGRFNFGEKLVLSLCASAKILSTTGGVVFDGNGRTATEEKTEVGSEFNGFLSMGGLELDDCLRMIHMMQPPEGITTTIHFCGEKTFEMRRRKPLASFTQTLETIVGDTLRETYRATQVDVLEPFYLGEGWVYEMGIPICKTGISWDIDIHQRVPMNMERDNVSWFFLHQLRPAVLNNMAEQLSDEGSREGWVTAALENESCSSLAAKAVIEKRFGDKVATFDPSDEEAGNTAVSKGYTILQPGQLSSAAWVTVRRTGAIPSAGRLFPTGGVPVGAGGIEALAPNQWPGGAENVVAYAIALAKDAIGKTITVELFEDLPGDAVAAYGDRRLALSVDDLGKNWFETFPTNRAVVDELLIHEFGHEHEGNHLSHRYHEALSTIGAKLHSAVLGGFSYAAAVLKGIA